MLNAFSSLDTFNVDSFIEHFKSNMSLIVDKYTPLKTVTYWAFFTIYTTHFQS